METWTFYVQFSWIFKFITIETVDLVSVAFALAFALTGKSLICRLIILLAIDFAKMYSLFYPLAFVLETLFDSLTDQRDSCKCPLVAVFPLFVLFFEVSHHLTTIFG